MVIADPHTILNAKPCIVPGELGVRGDTRENGKDELVREFENWGDGKGEINVISRGPARDSY